MSGLLSLAWRLARSGGRFRTMAVVGGNTVGAALFLLTVAVPEAIRQPGEHITSEGRLIATSVVVFLCLPITVLVMTIGRLSSSIRDRRLAALRLLGLSPARTRAVAAVENGLLAAAGAALGLAISRLATAPLESVVAAGPGWFRQPLELSWPATTLVCLGLVALSAAVSLAPTRSLHRGAMQVRREGAAARPSPWRLVPFGFGVVLLAISLTFPDSTEVDSVTGQWLSAIVVTAAVLTGVGLSMGLPVGVWAAADQIARRIRGVTGRLAARRLQSEPASAVRVISGVTIAAFLLTIALGVLAAFQANPQYMQEQRAYERGPQRHRIELLATFEGDDPEPPLTAEQLQGITTADGVRAVVPTYSSVAEDDAADAFSGDVFVGTCEQLAMVQVVPGCRDDRISLIEGQFTSYAPGQITSIPLTGRLGQTATVVPATAILRTDRRDASATTYELFVPITSPQLAPIAGDPISYLVLTDPGEAARAALRATAAELDVDVSLQYVQTYRDVQAYRVLVWTLAAVVLGVGLLAVLLTTIDRAIERRRQIASQVALGVPIRVLRASQLLQTLLPLWMGLATSIGAGHLAVVAYLRIANELAPAIGDTVVTMALAALVSAAVMAVATLPGIGGRLTPDLLRRE